MHLKKLVNPPIGHSTMEELVQNVTEDLNKENARKAVHSITVNRHEYYAKIEVRLTDSKSYKIERKSQKIENPN